MSLRAAPVTSSKPAASWPAQALPCRNARRSSPRSRLALTDLQIELMEADPYNVMGNVRARTANEMLHAFSHVARHERELELPIYAHHGTKDRLANLGVSCGLLLMTCCRFVWCIPITWWPLPWALHGKMPAKSSLRKGCKRWTACPVQSRFQAVCRSLGISHHDSYTDKQPKPHLQCGSWDLCGIMCEQCLAGRDSKLGLDACRL